MSAAAAPALEPDGRTRHFGAFYGLEAVPTDLLLALVHGNCQAESLRMALDGGGVRTVRVPPVHELTRADLPHLARWLARAQLLVTQPVRAGYRGLPLGAAELASQLPPGAGVVRVPVVRFAGLYPTHAIVRPPSDTSLVPPVVPYHDLRVLREAAARTAGTRAPVARLDVRAVLTVAAHSLAALRTRERAHGTVVVSDLFTSPSFAQMRTLNHPGNAVFETMAARVRARLRLPEHADALPRPLLDRLHAPREAAVIAAFGLGDEPCEAWQVDGAEVTAEAVREAHLAWYAVHPDAVDAGLGRLAGALRTLGLT